MASVRRGKQDCTQQKLTAIPINGIAGEGVVLASLDVEPVVDDDSWKGQSLTAQKVLASRRGSYHFARTKIGRSCQTATCQPQPRSGPEDKETAKPACCGCKEGA